jgi:hypothetical protein
VGAYFAGHPAFQKDCRVLVDEFEVLKHLYPLLIVRYKLEVLIRYRKFEIGDIGPQNLFAVENRILEQV